MRVTASGGQFIIEDTYWTEEDYTGALMHADLTIATVAYPMASDPSSWSTDEACISPCIIIKAVKTP